MNLEQSKIELQDQLNSVIQEAKAMLNIVDIMSCDQQTEWKRPVIVSPENNTELNTINELTIRWKGPINEHYDVRMNDHTDPSARLSGNNCGVDKHYLCRNRYQSNEITVPVKPGHEYRFWIHISGRIEYAQTTFKIRTKEDNTVKGSLYEFDQPGEKYFDPLYVSITFNDSTAVIYQIPNAAKEYSKQIIPLRYPPNGTGVEWLEGKNIFQYNPTGKNGKVVVTLGDGINSDIKRVSLRLEYLGQEFEQGGYIGSTNTPVDPIDPVDPHPGIQIGLKGRPLFMEAQGPNRYRLPNSWLMTTISKISSPGSSEVAQLHPWYDPLDWDADGKAIAFINAGSAHWKKVIVDNFVRDCQRMRVKAAGNDWESVFCIREMLPILEMQSTALRQAGIAVIHTPKRGMQHSLQGNNPQFKSKDEAYNWIKKWCDGIVWWDPSATIEMYKNDYCDGIANWCLSYDHKGVSPEEDQRIVRDPTGGIFNPKYNFPSVEYAKRVW